MDISEEGVTCLNIVYSFFFFYCLLGNQCVTRVAERAVMQLTQKKYKAVNVPGHKKYCRQGYPWRRCYSVLVCCSISPYSLS